jgi:hypothetical protein
MASSTQRLHCAVTPWVDNPVMRATPLKGISRHRNSTNASNSSVKPDSLPAHGGVICSTDPSGSFSHGTRTSSSQSCWQKFICR